MEVIRSCVASSVPSFGDLSPSDIQPCCIFASVMNKEKDIVTIRRADALREMETREDQYGHRVLYSVQFYKKNGEVVYLSHAYTCGLKMNMKERRMRGIQPCDSAGNKIGHSYAVSIDFLRMFNGKKVVL